MAGDLRGVRLRRNVSLSAVRSQANIPQRVQGRTLSTFDSANRIDPNGGSMKRPVTKTKAKINVTQNTEGLRQAKQFQRELSKKGGRAVPRAIASVVNS